MTHNEKKRLYESIMQDVSVRLKNILNEKYGSAHDNPDIFTDEIKRVIRDVMDAIRDGSYLKWDVIKIEEGRILYAKIFWLTETKWMEGVQICLWPDKDVMSGGAKASYGDGELEESGKMTAVINMFNVKPGHCEEIYYDWLIHEFKHAYFDYTKMKSGRVKYHLYGNKKMIEPAGRKFPLYDDSRTEFFDPREKSVSELRKEYKDDREKMSRDVILCLQYISQDTETAAYAENISLEIRKCARDGWSVEKIKNDSRYANLFIKMNTIMEWMEHDFKRDSEYKEFLEKICGKFFHSTFKTFWTLARKNIKKQFSNIMKNISLYY